MLAVILLAAHLRELQVPERLQHQPRPPVQTTAKSTGPIGLTFDLPAQNVTASSVTPAATTYWLGEAWATPSKILTPWHILDDIDSDGSVTWHLSQPFTSNALFAVVDDAGRVGIASPDWTIENQNRLTVLGDQLTVTNSFDVTEAMWVRPGVGAWFLDALENGMHDTDPQYGVLRVTTSAFQQYDVGYPAPPATFANGDIVIAFYPFDDAALHTYSLLRVGAAPAADAAIPTLSSEILIALAIILAIVGMLRVAR